jgi:hypothetical protein
MTCLSVQPARSLLRKRIKGSIIAAISASIRHAGQYPLLIARHVENLSESRVPRLRFIARLFARLILSKFHHHQ